MNSDNNFNHSVSILDSDITKISIKIIGTLLIALLLFFIKNFYLAFIFAIVGYLAHSHSHSHAHNMQNSTVSIPMYLIMSIIIYQGWIAWILMLFFDPYTMNYSSFLIPGISLVFCIIGILLPILARLVRKGFGVEDKLVTIGVYKYFRNPMYVGLILLHIFIPLYFGKLYTLISCIFFIPIIIFWMRIDDKDMYKVYGEEYLNYRKTTIL